MSYRIYIKKDYKPEIRWQGEASWSARYRSWCIGLLICLSGLALYFNSIANSSVITATETRPSLPISAAAIAAEETPAPAVSTHPTNEEPVEVPLELPQPRVVIPWKTVPIHSGDNLSLIFDRAGLTPAVLYQVMQTGKETAMLTRLMPGHEIRLHIDNGHLQALQYEPDPATTLQITRQDGGYASELLITELETRTRDVSAIIEDSLFLAGQAAGLSDNLIMRFVAIYGWDIDFALDIRTGDKFRLIFEEQYKDGVKVQEGNIIAAEFINQNKSYRAVRYTSREGETGYFSDTGYSMRKAFLRTPVKFSRISSRFSMSRKHPVLNTIRAHRGVDYAAPTGTPVKATGDGSIVFAGVNGGLGRTITIRHGGIYQTVYAHMSRLARGMKRGRQVRQGDIIGYVGMTGLASGPHLHYEFRVNGVHRNPLKVELPKALKIPSDQLPDFRMRTAPLLALLDQSPAENLILALTEPDTAETAVH